MAKKDIEEYICRPYCTFYREGVKEELICRGAQVVENLLRHGVIRITALSVEGYGFPAASADEAFLEDTVCSLCAFRRDDCDFQSQESPPDAEPCGGYILVNLLLRKGDISLADLTESGDEK
jgi:hypothetical protein